MCGLYEANELLVRQSVVFFFVTRKGAIPSCTGALIE